MEGLCEDCTTSETKDQTGLLLAAQLGHEKCVEVLIRSGADVNSRDGSSNTPIINAATAGHDKCVELLIKAEANVNKLNTEGADVNSCNMVSCL